MQERAIDDDDSLAAEYVDACILLWTRMLIADANHDNKIVENVIRLQVDCSDMLECLIHELEDHSSKCGRYIRSSR